MRFATLLLALLSPCVLASDFRDPVDGRFDVSAYLAENAFGFLPVPIIITEPAVDSGLGGFGLFFHESEEAAEKRKELMLSDEGAASALLPPNVSAVGGVVTGNESWFVGGGHMGFFKEGRIRYLGGGGYGDVDLDFYSVGNTALSRPISINTEAWGVVQTVKFKLGNSRFYFGPTHRYIKAELSPGNSFVEAFPPARHPNWLMR